MFNLLIHSWPETQLSSTHYACVRDRKRERERGRERERQRQTDRQTDRDTQREREREIQITETARDRERQADKQTDRKSERSECSYILPCVMFATSQTWPACVGYISVVLALSGN